jgi:hypothetical protein
MAHYRKTSMLIDYDYSNNVAFALSEFREKTIQWRGRTCMVVEISDSDFREWFYGLLDLLFQRGRSNELLMLRKECSQERMDEEMRWYACNELAGLRRYKASGIDMWTQTLPRPVKKTVVEGIKDIEQFLDILTPKEREAVELIHGIGNNRKMTGVEIAATYGVSRHAVYNAYSRAMAKIRDFVEVA